MKDVLKKSRMNSNGLIDLKYCRQIRNVKIGNYRHIILIDLKTNLIYLKIIFQKKYESHQDEKNFITSMQKISRISGHPSLLPIINFEPHENNQFPTITTIYMANGTLSEVMANIHKYGDLNFTGTKKYINLLGISIGMRFFYFNFIIHGNLSMNNIFLDENYYPHIVNYEIYKEATDEEFYFKRIRAQSDDLYNFSIIAYELITGKKPFSESEMIENKKRTIKMIPDCSMIKSQWLQTFLLNGFSSDFFVKPFFSMIYKEIIQNKKEFETVFGEIDDKEVKNYINMINHYFLSFSNKVREKADQGDLESIFLYGNFLYFGYGIEEDKEKASKYFKIAADHGRSNAMYYYALMLEKGDGIKKNDKEAVRYYKMAADLGHPDAMNSYGLMLDNGQGIESNKEQAAFYYKKAADLGNLVSMNNYGIMLEFGTGVEPNQEEAVKYYKMAADEGNCRGMLNYYVSLDNGDGVPKDTKEAIRYLKMAADQNNECALFGYAQLLDFGEDISMNKTEAAKYYKMSADRGYMDAMFYYGDMLESGEGVKMDKFEAARYYKMATSLGHEKASEAYRRISYTLNYSL